MTAVSTEAPVQVVVNAKLSPERLRGWGAILSLCVSNGLLTGLYLASMGLHAPEELPRCVVPSLEEHGALETVVLDGETVMGLTADFRAYVGEHVTYDGMLAGLGVRVAEPFRHQWAYVDDALISGACDWVPDNTQA
jgi:hypothetical protein